MGDELYGVVISIRPTEDCGIGLCLTPPSLHANIRSDSSLYCCTLIFQGSSLAIVVRSQRGAWGQG